MAFVTKTLSNGEKLLIPISIEEMNSLLKDQEEEEEEKNKIFTMYLSLESGKINEDIKRLFQVQENISSVDMDDIDEYYMWKKLNELNFKIISNKIKKIVALNEWIRLRKEEEDKKCDEEYNKPIQISNELATFLGKKSGTKMARTAVASDINAYIRANNLQDRDNGRKINLDHKLSVLLKIKANEELTYFNLQQYLTPHFIK
jgi:upstream activation factor subunit UAF30